MDFVLIYILLWTRFGGGGCQKNTSPGHLHIFCITAEM